METPPPKLRALHVGDLHFWRIPLNPLLYLNKRFLGVGNLVVGGRGRRFRQEMAPLLCRRLEELAPDAFLFSGDFSSTSVPGEFRAARECLEPIVRKAPLGAYAIPGNHDCYLASELDARALAEGLGDAFRPCRSLAFDVLADEVGLLRINATTSNGLGSHGRIAPEHAERIDSLLKEHHGKIKVLWFLCHFPAEDPPQAKLHDRGPQLPGGEMLFPIFEALSLPVLWLHGHHHYRWIYGSPSARNVTYLNAGAPLMRRHGQAPDMGFHEIHGDGSARIVTHRLSAQQGDWISREVALPGPGEYEDLQAWE